MRSLLLLAFLITQHAGANDSVDALDFRAAYTGYQQALEGTDKKARLKYARMALEAGIRELGEIHPNIPELRYNYGYELLNNKMHDEATGALKQAIKDYERKYGKASIKLLPVLLDYGKARANQESRYGSSPRKPFNRAKKLVAAEYGKKSMQYAKILVDIGVIITENTNTTDGKGYLREAMKILEELAPDSPLYGIAGFNLGKIFLSARRPKKSLPEFEKALSIFGADHLGDNRIEMTTRAFMIDALETLGRRDEATEHCQAIGRMTPVSGNQEYQPLIRRAPKYPLSMARLRRQGQVLVEFAVDDEGFVRDGRVVETAGDEAFAEEALRVIDSWRFAPRFIEGKPVRTEGVQTIITFKLSD